MQREPQPVKLFTIALDVPVRQAAARPLPRALAALAREHRLGRPRDRRRGDPVLRHAAPESRRRALRAPAQLDRRPQLPSRVRREAERVARRARRRPRRRCASRSARRARSGCSTSRDESVREALQDAPKIGESLCDECAEHFAQVRALPRRVRRRVHDRADARPRPRLLHAHDVRVRRAGREHAGLDDLRRRPLRLSRSRRSAARRHPGVGFGAGIERLVLSLELEGVTADAPTLDVFLVVDGGARADALALAGSSFVQRGIAADTDYAGRSLKGQLTQAQKLRRARRRDLRSRRLRSRFAGAASRMSTCSRTSFSKELSS